MFSQVTTLSEQLASQLKFSANYNRLHCFAHQEPLSSLIAEARLTRSGSGSLRPGSPSERAALLSLGQRLAVVPATVAGQHQG